MKIIVVIPARGGSKGIPRKNLNMMNGKPLISYAIENAMKISGDVDIAISTDDEEIERLAARFPVTIIRRPSILSEDNVTLDPVVYHAVNEMEKHMNSQYDIVVTMQPTSPTLRCQSIHDALLLMQEKNLDTVISAKNSPHLSWRKENGAFVPNYVQRLNRQQLPGYYVETGGFLITRRGFVTETSRIGKNISVFEISEDEAIDIDTHKDWILCEAILKKKRIVMRADGEENLGMGHIYRCLMLAYKLIGHEVCFVCKQGYVLGIKKIEQSFMPLKVVNDDSEFYDFLSSYKPDILINDILNTDKDYMLKVKSMVDRVVNFEDIGEGAQYADVVVNALYEEDSIHNNVYNGLKYFCIRDEFLEEGPSEFSSKVNNILILFGGSDPSNLTMRMYEICKKIHKKYNQIKFNFVTGFGYKYKSELKTDIENNIFVYHDVKRVSSYMKEADLAVTSQGRTIFELACMGVPAIVMAQNTRETYHAFAQLKNGFINLGLGYELDEQTILQTIDWMINTPQVRKEMRNLLLTKEFQKGQERVLNLILGINDI